MLTFCPLYESVDLRHSDYVSEHVAKPLRINKVEMAQGWRVVVQHDTLGKKK